MEVAWLVEPYLYLRGNGEGKGFRNELLLCFNEVYQLSDERLRKVQEVIDILHNSSLLIDDIEDGSHMRRGKRCAHEVYGVPSTINTGNLMYFEALKKLLELGDSNDNITAALSRLFADSMVKLHIGQGKEIYWRDHCICPTEEEYFEMVIGKTGELFKLGVRIMATLSMRNENTTIILEKFCDELGKYYQIENDLQGLATGDLAEGKFTYPILVAVHSGAVTVEEVHQCSVASADYDGKDNDDHSRRILAAVEAAGGSARARDLLQRLSQTMAQLLHDADVSADVSGRLVLRRLAAQESL